MEDWKDGRKHRAEESSRLAGLHTCIKHKKDGNRPKMGNDLDRNH